MSGCDGVAELLKQIQLPPQSADRHPVELSGGQKQRVCIVRVLAARPEVIMSDEVISDLDPLVTDGILRLLFANPEGDPRLLPVHQT